MKEKEAVLYYGKCKNKDNPYKKEGQGISIIGKF
jgi:hypothetical protein